jgi:hypothetical protein
MLSLVKNRIRVIKNPTPSTWFWVFFGISAIIRFFLLLRPTHPWWDASVYQAMARAIHSGGTYGAWELFRPPLWPIILSLFSGFGPIIQEWIAKIIVLLLSLGILFLVYKIGERITAWVGVVASVLLSFAIPFLTFSVVPMTEIPSLFLITLAIYCFIEKRWFWAGIIAGLAFLTRFPTILVMGAFAVMVIIQTIDLHDLAKSFWTLVKRGLTILAGCLIITIPFFITSALVYGSATLPLTTGQGMITGFMWLYQGNYLFYIKKIALANIVTIAIIPTMIIGCLRWKTINNQKRDILTLLGITILIFLAYFSTQPHKEFRYILPIFPSLFIVVSAGLVWVAKRISWARYMIAILVIISIGTGLYYVKFFQSPETDTAKFYQFYTALSDVIPGTSIITSTPTITTFSPVRLYEGYNSWEQMNTVYEENKSQASYVAIDTCELHACAPGTEKMCEQNRRVFMEKLSKETKTVYHDYSNQCEFIITSINH